MTEREERKDAMWIGGWTDGGFRYVVHRHRTTLEFVGHDRERFYWTIDKWDIEAREKVETYRIREFSCPNCRQREMRCTCVAGFFNKPCKHMKRLKALDPKAGGYGC